MCIQIVKIKIILKTNCHNLVPRQPKITYLMIFEFSGFQIVIRTIFIRTFKVFLGKRNNDWAMNWKLKNIFKY